METREFERKRSLTVSHEHYQPKIDYIFLLVKILVSNLRADRFVFTTHFQGLRLQPTNHPRSGSMIGYALKALVVNL